MNENALELFKLFLFGVKNVISLAFVKVLAKNLKQHLKNYWPIHQSSQISYWSKTFPSEKLIQYNLHNHKKYINLKILLKDLHQVKNTHSPKKSNWLIKVS